MNEDNNKNIISLDEKDIRTKESLFYDPSFSHGDIKYFVRPLICSVSTATDSFRCSTYSSANYMMTCPYNNTNDTCIENKITADGLKEKKEKYIKYIKCEEDYNKNLNYMCDNEYVDPYNISTIENEEEMFYSMFKNEKSNITNIEGNNNNNNKYPSNMCRHNLNMYANEYDDSKNFSSFFSNDNIYHNSISNNHIINEMPFCNRKDLKKNMNINNININNIKIKSNKIKNDQLFKQNEYEKDDINKINKQTYDVYKNDETYNDMMIKLMNDLNINDNYNNKEKKDPDEDKNIQDVIKNGNYFKDYISDVYNNLINENINDNKEKNNINKYNIFNNHIDNDNINSNDNYIYINKEEIDDDNKDKFSFWKSNLDLKKENNNIYDTCNVFINDNYNDHTHDNYYYNLKKEKKVSFDINKDKIIDHPYLIDTSYPFLLQNNIKDNQKDSLFNSCVDLNILYPNKFNEEIFYDSEDKDIMIDDDYKLRRGNIKVEEKENKTTDNETNVYNIDINKNSIMKEEEEENIKDNINLGTLSNCVPPKNDYININNYDDEEMEEGTNKKKIFPHIKENNNNNNYYYYMYCNSVKNNYNTYYNYNNVSDKSTIISENYIYKPKDIEYNDSSNYSNNLIYPVHNECNTYRDNTSLIDIKDQEPVICIKHECDNKDKINDMLYIDNCLNDKCININEEEEEKKKKNIFENMKTYNFLCNLLNDKKEDFRDNNNLYYEDCNNEYITSQTYFEENNNMNEYCHNNQYNQYNQYNNNYTYDNCLFEENMIYPENYNNIIEDEEEEKDKDIILKKKKSLAKYTLIVNVPPNTTRKDLMTVFSQFGNVDLTMVVCDKESRHPNKEWTATSGYSFVRFSTNIEARKTLTAATCGLIKIRGSKVRATWAKKDSYSKREKDIVFKIPSSILIINIQEFICCICKIYLSYQPILFPCCFVSSCSDCFTNYIINDINQQNFKCPNCNIILNDKIIKLDKHAKGTLALLYKYYSNIKVKCPHTGCIWIGYHYQYVNHFISCKYNIPQEIKT
ncbi:conserved Plasmodium protein, unknown function [Plasmodium gaboni]|uniref:RRM domain-containing protein n=1 Tax=Plasmodium gaboni TaxID=647221 RepID=A0ABY1UPF4_9APIC|nr:conserved Plasmodium protein, unknown function [Plasmodium gaboni]